VAATDDVVEQEADEHPGYVVHRRQGWHIAYASEYDREVEVLKKRHLKFLVESPLDKWGNSTDHEKEDEAVVRLTVGEETPWSNDTPLWKYINK
jgi:kynurenine formamidase